ncbi:MAG: hypothetical protein SH809_08560 [Rhodothermales bacterium]|nr:hypothetical protein [Rhodothermales bacterium]
MKNYERWFKRNAIAEQKENEGKFDDAIRIYENNVEEDADSLFPYERLAILYKRKSDRTNEKRILQKGLQLMRERAAQGRIDTNQEVMMREFNARLEKITGQKLKRNRV